MKTIIKRKASEKMQTVPVKERPVGKGVGRLSIRLKKGASFNPNRYAF